MGSHSLRSLANWENGVKLVAQSVTADKKQREQVPLLSRAGLDRHEIAEHLDTTPGTGASVELSLLKKTNRRKR